jgi:hypothetical protein
MYLDNSIVQKFSQRDRKDLRKLNVQKQSAMIGKTNSNLFEGVNVQFFEKKKNNNSEIRMPYENMQMKIRNKAKRIAFY